MIVDSIYSQLPWPEHALAQAASVTEAKPARLATAANAREVIFMVLLGGLVERRGWVAARVLSKAFRSIDECCRWRRDFQDSSANFSKTKCTLIFQTTLFINLNLVSGVAILSFLLHVATIITIMDDDGSNANKKASKSLPEGAAATLKAWMMSPENITHPYPTPQDQALLMQKTGIDEKQLKNWFTNARRRIWKPMLKKQLEEGKLTTVAGVGVVTVPPDGAAAAAADAAAALTGLPPPSVTPAAAATGGEPLYGMPPTDGNVHIMPQQQQYHLQPTYQYGQWPQGPGQGQQYGQQPGMMPIQSNVFFGRHAVLMELFARDQELVRQAAEGARLQVMARAALMGGSSGGGGDVGAGGIAIGGGQNDKVEGI